MQILTTDECLNEYLAMLDKNRQEWVNWYQRASKRGSNNPFLPPMPRRLVFAEQDNWRSP